MLRYRCCCCCNSPPTPLFSLCVVKVEEVTLDDAGNDTRRVTEGGYGVVCSTWTVVRYRRRHAMPRLLVDVLSTADEPAGCWFHHEKATPPELYCTILTAHPGVLLCLAAVSNCSIIIFYIARRPGWAPLRQRWPLDGRHFTCSAL